MRVEKYLSNLIHTDQTGFVKGRYIGQNIGLLSDVMDYADYKKLPGILSSKGGSHSTLYLVLM